MNAPHDARPVAGSWLNISNDPYAKGRVVARSLEEMPPETAPYPDSWEFSGYLYTATDYDALRNYLALANKTNKGLLEERDALRAEVERLREALSAIEKLGCDARTPIRNNVKMRGIARAALNYQGQDNE